MATITGATLMPASCSKVEKEEPHDVEIEFDIYNGGTQLDMQLLKDYAHDPFVTTIYLVPVRHLNSCVAGNITFLRKKFLQPRMNISSKIRGRGDFDFVLGEASKVPTDSLWFVKNGWTINKNYQK